MSENISQNQKKQAYLWILGELQGLQKQRFSDILSQSPELQQYVKELESIVKPINNLLQKHPAESYLIGQRNLLRARIESLESESFYSRISRQIKSRIQVISQIPVSTRPVLMALAYIFVGIVTSRFLLFPTIPVEHQNESAIPIEKRIQATIEKGQLTATDIEYIKNGSDKIAFQLKSEDEFGFTGDVNDALVKELLYYLLLNDANPGKRLRSVKLLSELSSDDDAKKVLIASLLSDSNPGIRLRAIRSLSTFESDKNVIDVCIKILMEDENSAVRMEALNILSKHPEERMSPVFQVVARLDDNEFIRDKAVSLLMQIKETIELRPIGEDMK